MADQQQQLSISETLSTWKNNFQRNTTNAFADMRPKDYIRLVIIVGTYCLIRPWLMKLGAHMQAKQHKKDSEETAAEIHPNELRGGKGKIEIPGLGDSDEEEDAEETQPGQWGRTARVRQRKFIRQTLEKEEKRLRDEQEDESDKEIEEFLVG
ncbi:DUF1531-domain-containing protein [Lophiostoma macrostomum CBS 122681]|uniref:DUF1531-domain-containing protein n=1 Tax=Lophiostoma macrostomum CBS 122681 TaxID=1314788 RepID=A0A6A6TEP7_9PLEO|nr:DUF1531-domain-containing protein [Lophiostoma macrostomum CBS 122681]